MNSSVERVYFPNPGKLRTVIAPGREVLCKPATTEGRKTNFAAFAVRLSKFYVTVNSSFANTIFSTAIDKGILSEFEGCVISSRERSIPNYGRMDFVLRDRKDRLVYVEVKSSTHVEKGVAKFPDRPTERGRRHLMVLSKLAAKGTRCYAVFIIQRPDARRFELFREVDPEFADLLSDALRAGVNVRVMVTEFSPPNLYLVHDNLEKTA